MTCSSPLNFTMFNGLIDILVGTEVSGGICFSTACSWCNIFAKVSQLNYLLILITIN